MIIVFFIIGCAFLGLSDIPFGEGLVIVVAAGLVIFILGFRRG